MKKFFACLLAVAMLLSLAGCGLGINIPGNIIPEQNNVRGEVEPAPTAAPIPQPVATEPVEVAPAETEPQFAIGSNNGNTYKNTFIGIQCTLDSNWVFKTDEEMRAVNEATIGAIGDAYKDAVANAQVVNDMMATHSNGMDTVNVVMEKLSAAYLLITEEQYLNLSKDSALGGLESMGFVIDKSEVVKMQFAGAEHYALVLEGSYAGIPFYETLVVVKCTGYIACVTTATWYVNACADILSQFKPC